MLRSSRGAGFWQNSGKSLLVLRPQPVHDEGEGPRRRIAPCGGVAALAGRLAERRRPRQRQHIEIELAGLVLAPILGGARSQRRTKQWRPTPPERQYRTIDAPDHCCSPLR